MDVLLSLPILSYFLAPTVTSWSTSLNLLFFYMTWSALVLSHPPWRIELLSVLALRLVLWLLPSLVFLLFDSLLPSLAAGIKYRGQAGLPPRDPALLARTAALALFNLVLMVAVEGLVGLVAVTLSSVPFFSPSDWRLPLISSSASSSSSGWIPAAVWTPSSSWSRPQPLFRTSSALPLPWQVIKHIALLIAARVCLTYYVHRYLLHGAGTRGRGRLARWHASYAHARRAPPYSLALLADHPVPLLLHRLLPVLLPAALLRPHLLTYLAFVALVAGEETLASSGYTVVPGIVMGGIARRTTLHYCCPVAAGRSGNFGAWGLLDWVHGTSAGGDVVEDVRDEAEKHRVKERGQRAAGGVMDSVQDGIDGVRKGKKGGRKGRKRSGSE